MCSLPKKIDVGAFNFFIAFATRISFIFRFRTHTTKSLEGLLNSEGRYSIYELVTLSDTISHNIST